MGSDYGSKSWFAPVMCQRVKLCIAFACMLGLFGILTSVVEHEQKQKDVSTNQEESMALALAKPAVPSFSKLMNHMNPNNYVWHNKYDLVHVVETDFLQYQLNLNHLRDARLALFETFTIPSMKQQSNNEFLWLIWTDPQLGNKERDLLKHLLSDFPNAILLGFRRDRKIDFREFNGISEEEIEDALIYGSKKLLLEYYVASQEHVLIETRLDADDALNKEFIETIQSQAADTIGKSDLKNDYRIFCPEHHAEWRYYKPNEPDNAQGHLVHYHNPTFCINTGLTIGYQLEAKSRYLANLEQSNMNAWYQECVSQGFTGFDAYVIAGTTYIRHYCTSRLRGRRRRAQEEPEESDSSKEEEGESQMAETKQEEESLETLMHMVLLSRTPTAAGMKRVLGTESSYKKTFENKQDQAWTMVEHDFGVSKTSVLELRRRMQQNITNILRDALAGQCMPEHSCKSSTKRKLMKLLELNQAKA